MVRRKGAAAPIVIGILGAAALLGLGAWQVQRLEWKEALIADLEARMAADPVALPAEPDPVRDQNLRVRVRGTIGPQELDVLTSIKNVGPGFRIVAPMLTSDGRRIMIDLGYVREALKDIEDRPSSPRLRGDGAMGDVIGILRWPEVDTHAPKPDEDRQMWFARDVPAMAAALDAEEMLVIAERHPMGALPLPRPPGVDLFNRHLEYALTWFGLAAVWAAMSAWWCLREMRRPAG